MITKLEKILNHQQHLHFNIPYGPDDISNPGWFDHYGAQAYSEVSAEKEALEKRLKELNEDLNNDWEGWVL